MSGVAASVALAVAERVERTGGPRAGLLAWKTLAGNSTDAEVRGKALLAALRCALALRDVGAIADLTLLWETVERGVWDAPIAKLCKELVRAGFVAQATALAGTESRRHRTALSLYVFARHLEIGGAAKVAAAAATAGDSASTASTTTSAAFQEAAMRAEKEGAKEIETASRVRRAALLALSWNTMADALEEAKRVVDVAKLTPAFQLVIARVRLFSPSRFERAAAIGVLDDLVSASGSSSDADKDKAARFASRALMLAAEWADDAGDSMTPLEADRLAALFGRERVMSVAPRAKEALRLLTRANAHAKEKEASAFDAILEEAARFDPSLEPLHVRARDILRGRFEAARDNLPSVPTDAVKRRAFRHGEILDVVVAIRDRAPARAAHSLRLLAEAEASGEHLPRDVLGVAHAALAYDDAELRDVAVRLLAARLRRASFGAPPRGFLALADTLASLGHEELSSIARRAATVAKEPGAAESLGLSLARVGWARAHKGEGVEAIQKLREAKALLEPLRK